MFIMLLKWCKKRASSYHSVEQGANLSSPPGCRESDGLLSRRIIRKILGKYRNEWMIRLYFRIPTPCTTDRPKGRLMNTEIQALEEQISSLTLKLAKLRQATTEAAEVPNYSFETMTGSVDLASLFGGKEILFAIHNMGQGCRYCTLWADGLNGFLPHLEDKFSVVLLSKDAPELQQQFGNSRGWRFRMASHGGGAYISEQSVLAGESNMPGMVCYQRKDGKITRKSSAGFGPGDLFCSMWHILSLAGIGEEDWTPQYSYWKRPEAAKMEDGGNNLA
jgi:predicted dithiol-disulfide oxidoreductase (DUF899 family)